MKRLTMLLVGGFVCLSIAASFIPLVFGVTVSAVTDPMQLAVITAARWIIPLAGAVMILLFGLSKLRKRG